MKFGWNCINCQVGRYTFRRGARGGLWYGCDSCGFTPIEAPK